MWIPYPSIPEHLPSTVDTSGPWIVTEKIHGANTAVYSECGVVGIAARKRRLAPDELDWHFGISALWPQLAAAVAALADVYGDVAIYGEVYGGHYPDVGGDQPVQTGVWYSPDIQFSAFDILYGDPPRWASAETFQTMTDMVGIKRVPVLAHCTYQRAMTISYAFRTRVPVNVPILARNPAEGLVLKSLKETPLSQPRPIFKRKHPKFAEDSRYHGARPYIPSQDDGWIVYEAAALLTPSRIASARSKGVSDVAKELWHDICFALVDQLGPLDEATVEELRQTLYPVIEQLCSADSQ